jgi:quercetin dioxygenase-like cupin family protein
VLLAPSGRWQEYFDTAAFAALPDALFQHYGLRRPRMGLPPEHALDIASALRQAATNGPIWSVSTAQLNVNLLRLSAGDGIAAHVNNEVDVVIVVFEGHGELAVDGVAYPLEAGRVVVVPQGASRALRCTAGPLIYLTCHHRRAGLMPTETA